MSSNKILFVCSDTAAFTYDSKYRLKDKYRVYDSHENEDVKEDDISKSAGQQGSKAPGVLEFGAKK